MATPMDVDAPSSSQTGSSASTESKSYAGSKFHLSYSMTKHDDTVRQSLSVEGLDILPQQQLASFRYGQCTSPLYSGRVWAVPQSTNCHKFQLVRNAGLSCRVDLLRFGPSPLLATTSSRLELMEVSTGCVHYYGLCYFSRQFDSKHGYDARCAGQMAIWQREDERKFFRTSAFAANKV